jgi:hypothetical protein
VMHLVLFLANEISILPLGTEQIWAWYAIGQFLPFQSSFTKFWCKQTDRDVLANYWASVIFLDLRNWRKTRQRFDYSM